MRDDVQRHLVFFDEAGIWCKRTCGRAPRGQRYGPCELLTVVAEDHTVIFAVSATRGLINHDTRDRGMTNEHFRNFLEEMVC